MNDPQLKLKKIIQTVCLFHILMLLLMMVNFKPSKKRVLYTKKVLKENVRVIEKKRPKRVIAKAKKAPVKTVPQKKTVKTSSKTSSKVAAKKTLPKLEKELAQPKEEMVSIVLPKAIAKLDVEEIEIKEVDDSACGRYVENLHALIKQAINLKPDSYVSIELSLNKKGEILEVKHLHSSDAISKDKIVKKIKEIDFPDFFGEIGSESEYTFVLTLKGPLL